MVGGHLPVLLRLINTVLHGMVYYIHDFTHVLCCILIPSFVTHTLDTALYTRIYLPLPFSFHYLPLRDSFVCPLPLYATLLTLYTFCLARYPRCLAFLQPLPHALCRLQL